MDKQQKQAMKDLKAERIKLFRDQANFIPTERVPHFCNAVTWKVFDAHRSLPIALTDFKVMEDVVRHFLDNYPVDGLMDTGIRNQFSVMEAFGSEGYYYYTEDSVGIRDHALCTIDTLMNYLEDEERYTWETVLPAKFGDEWNEKTLDQWKAAFKEYLKYTYFIIHMGSVTGKEYGVPSLAPNNPAKGAIQFGIEELESNLLGIKELSVSLRRHKDLIKEFCDKWDEKHIDPMIAKALESDGPQTEKYCFDSSMILLSHNILNPKQFDMFLWPSLSRMLDAYAEKNMNVRIFAEGSILRYAEKFNRYPKGTITFHLEQDDPFEFREAAPNCAIMGGLSTEMLSTATPEECIAHTKMLCDKLGRQGGFILSEGKMLSYKNDAKADNLKAICDFVSNYKL
ncbi:MAG: hypothetical protein IJI32_03200 [Clostridia bacterium]|nr:hypothetical protein [Clostridia bacterium]MBQ6525616.1 hypothetical protein [Clostridia bacterium]